MIGLSACSLGNGPLTNPVLIAPDPVWPQGCENVAVQKVITAQDLTPEDTDCFKAFAERFVRLNKKLEAIQLLSDDAPLDAISSDQD